MNASPVSPTKYAHFPLFRYAYNILNTLSTLSYIKQVLVEIYSDAQICNSLSKHT